MATWTSEELTKIGTAEELEIASLRRDGTLRNPVTIWVVRIGDDLYVRAYKGRNGLWFRNALVRHAGHIQAGGIHKDVAFIEQAAPEVNEEIDAAYRTKYRRYPEYVAPMLTVEARAATIKLVPRTTKPSFDPHDLPRKMTNG